MKLITLSFLLLAVKAADCQGEQSEEHSHTRQHDRRSEEGRRKQRERDKSRKKEIKARKKEYQLLQSTQDFPANVRNVENSKKDIQLQQSTQDLPANVRNFGDYYIKKKTLYKYIQCKLLNCSEGNEDYLATTEYGNYVKENIAEQIIGLDGVESLRKLTRPHRKIELCLKDIFYGHDKIWDHFGSGKRGFKNKTIHETIEELNTSKIDSNVLWKELGLIEVMKYYGRYYAIGGNRRLYCLKHSARFSPESRIMVNEIHWDPILAARNINTKTYGKTVKVLKKGKRYRL